MTSPNSLRPHQVAFVTACVISVALWFIPLVRWITVPLQYLNTHIHEAWHALMAIATGGMVSHIEVHANGNGETYTLGGSNFLISSAGYLGASLIGAAMVALSRNPRMARAVIIGAAVLVGYSLLVWVRRDMFGMVSAAAWIFVLVIAAVKLSDEHKLFAAQFIGVQQCLNSLQSLFFLVRISGFGIQQSDAGNMQQLTGIPAIVWAVVWCGVSIALMLWALKSSWGSSQTNQSFELK